MFNDLYFSLISDNVASAIGSFPEIFNSFNCGIYSILENITLKPLSSILFLETINVVKFLIQLNLLHKSITQFVSI